MGYVAAGDRYLVCSDGVHDVVADSLVGFANEANFVICGEKDTHAYWIERVRIEKRPSHLRLVAAPLSVADDLRKMFYDVKDSVVLCSATLRVGNDFKYMARRLGCGAVGVRGVTVPATAPNAVASASPRTTREKATALHQ